MPLSNPFDSASEIYSEVDLPSQAAHTQNFQRNVSFRPEGDEEADTVGYLAPHDPDDDLNRKDSRVTRHRWGTQRHAHGRPKRHASLFRSRSTRKEQAKREEEELPQAASERHIFFNTELPAEFKDPESGLPVQSFARNKIRTTKYTPLSFVPKNLYLQFRNIANIYFLFIVILGAFPIFGVQNPGLAAVPIVVIVVITAIKDAIEDYRRTLLDLEINNMRTEVLDIPNYNVVDENISYWRRIKKWSSHTLMKLGSWISRKKAERRGKVYKPKHAALPDNVSVMSDYSLEDMQPEETFNPNESVLQPQAPRLAAGGKFKPQYWKNVKVGDFIRIRNDQEIPADVVIMSTSEEDGACYVETKNLDGETNLKVRQALRCGLGMKRAADCDRAQFWVESEGPVANLYTYRGVLRWQHYDGGKISSEPISINNLLLRGCTLRNTEWAIGMVVYTGMDTKIMMNSGITPTKRSRLQRSLNLYVIYNFVILFLLCFVSGLINGIYYRSTSSSADYFDYNDESPPVNGVITFWAAVILYQSLVPISLYISIEIVKTCQVFYIYSDCYMYYDKIDYPCTPKSWNISDDLGQIEYIFSDKTGTLTQNVMEFRKCTINGVAYGKAYTEAMAGLNKRNGLDTEDTARQMEFEIAQDKQNMIRRLATISDNAYLIPDRVTFVSDKYVRDLTGDSGEEQAKANFHFMLALALCNSVITEAAKDIPGHKDFKAQSPDEAALVSAARDMGFALEGRTRRGVMVNVQGEEREYQLLNILEFNSTRKRMSVIVKFDNRILLICKGADSIIYERLVPDQQKALREQTAVQLEQFANEGLRTLCIAEREISAKEYADWNARHEAAAAAIHDREEQLEEVADSIERNLSLLGGTAIEDRLQDGVPSTISLLAEAGIKLWVLTGDKVETAINIGFSCNLLRNDMSLLVIKVEGGDEASVPAQIDEYLHKYFHMSGSHEEMEAARRDHSVPHSDFAVVIDGDALKLALHPAVQNKFMLLCKQCHSVLCCRVSPAQKAAVVRMVRRSLGVITLSIGDGANDVSMIQEADVGVGIAGEEGRQAAMSSDYAIGQFRFLSRLVLVHGRWSYKRLAEMIPNFFYKNVVFTFTMFWYGIFTNFDMSYLYDYTFVMFFNLAFTSIPVILMGILDQDVPDKLSLAVPQLYRRGILQLDFTQLKFWIYMFEGLYQSFISFFFPYWVWSPGRFEHMKGLPVNQRFWIGIPVCTIAVMSCNFFVMVNQYRWDIVSVIINVISSVLVFFWAGVYSASVFSQELYMAAAEVYGTLDFWAVILLGVITCAIPHVSHLMMRMLWHPLDVEIIREQWKMGEFDEVMANPLAADDPDTGNYKNPHRPQTFKQHDIGGKLKRFSKLSRNSNHRTYELPNDSHHSVLNSPRVVKIGNTPIDAEIHTFHGEQRPSDHARKSLSNDQRKSLDVARRSAVFEQRPGEGWEQEYYTTQDLDDVTTAAGLIRTLSRDPNQYRPREGDPF